LEALHWSGVSALGRMMFGGRGAILMLHHVRPAVEKLFAPNAHLEVTPCFLNALLSDLKRDGYDFIAMDEVADRLESPGERPFLAVTLDDGYRDNLEHAAPIFRRLNIPYCIYIAPGMVDGETALWWEDLERVIAAQSSVKWLGKDYPTANLYEKLSAYEQISDQISNVLSEPQARAALATLCRFHGEDWKKRVKEELLSWRELEQLKEDQLCTLGAHSMEHFMLAKLSEKDAKQDLEVSRASIVQKLGIPVKHLAYPYGFESACGAREYAMAMDVGFTTAVTTRHGVLNKNHIAHLHGLPRISVNGRFQKERLVKGLLSGIPALMINKGRPLGDDLRA